MPPPDPISPAEEAPSGLAPVSSPPPEDPPWNLFDVVMILVFAVFANILVLGIALFVAHFIPEFHALKPVELVDQTLVNVTVQTAAYALLVAFMVQLVRLKNRGGFFAAISWCSPSAKQLIAAVAAGIGLALAAEVFGDLLSRFVPKSLPIDTYFSNRNSAYLLASFGVVVAPFVEELFFRGFLYPALARPIGVSASVVITAASFAVIHQQQLAHAWVPLTWLFIMGLVLTLVRARTKSVALCFIIHVIYNAALFALIFIGTHGFTELKGT